MEQVAGGWRTTCDGSEYESASLEEAIRDAVGHERGATLQLGAATHESIGGWVVEQARRIEQEAGA